MTQEEIAKIISDDGITVMRDWEGYTVCWYNPAYGDCFTKVCETEEDAVNEYLREIGRLK